MKIALLHFHLKRGGVSTVIRQQVDALGPCCDCMVISSSPPPEPFACHVAVVPGLGYDTERQRPEAPAAVADAVQEAIFSRWPGGCDILHVHNPLLAKNRDFMDILHILQQRGMTLFLHIHDFAEDGRPQVYFQQDYPADCHYGVINSRDYDLLLQAGLDVQGLHLIPNAVEGPRRKMPDTQNDEPPRVLYPVRAIRRKNIGEAILLSLFFDCGRQLAVTLPPNSPADMLSYRDWKAFVAKFDLAVAFEAGLTQDFSELVSGSHLILTTSITEGFGFCYTEPWLYQKPLWGRIIPDICRDFIEKGLFLGHLYDRLEVPLTWFDSGIFFEKWRTAVIRAAGSFGIRPPTDRIVGVSEGCSQRGSLDFGMLDEACQQKVIQHLLTDAGARKNLAAMNPFLSDRPSWTPSTRQITHNRRVVESSYALPQYRDLLVSAYRQVREQPVRHRIDKRRLLDLFFDLEHFSLLKWSAYDNG